MAVFVENNGAGLLAEVVVLDSSIVENGVSLLAGKKVVYPLIPPEIAGR